MWERFLRKLVRTLDPKLEKYREREPVKAPQKYTPRTVEEFVGVLQRTPKSVLSKRDRDRIAAVMSYEERKVGELMATRDKIIFVKSDEVLGPLVLDKLYKSGYTNFPVVNGRERVVGILNTGALNALEVRKTDTAGKYIDKQVYYLRAEDSLQFAVEEIVRTGAGYFLVQDAQGETVGFFTISMLLSYLLG